MWTPETRARHNRDHLRYGSDLSDEEWQILASLLPPPAKTGRRRVWPMREMLNAIFYVLRSAVRGGCCPNTSRRIRRPIAGSFAFATTACGRA